MTEPRRLVDEEGGELERSLLLAARDDAPSRGARKRTLAALGLGVGVLGAGTTAASTAAAAKAASSGVLAWIGFGVTAGVLAVGAAGVAGSLRGAAPASSGPAPSLTPAITAPARLPVDEGAPAAADRPPRAPAPSAHPEAPRPRAAERSLADEVAALDAAREALAAGDGARALAVLDRHDRDFPGGALGSESTVLRVEALALRGDRAAASRLGEAFLAANPRSPHASRIRERIREGAAPAP